MNTIPTRAHCSTTTDCITIKRDANLCRFASLTQKYAIFPCFSHIWINIKLQTKYAFVIISCTVVFAAAVRKKICHWCCVHFICRVQTHNALPVHSNSTCNQKNIFGEKT